MQLESAQFRKRATKKAVFGFCGTAAIIAPLVVLSNEDYIPKSILWAFLATVPFGYYVIGTVEFITEHPYGDLAVAWVTLRRLQKVYLCAFLTIVALFLFVVCVGSVLNIWIIARGDG